MRKSDPHKPENPIPHFLISFFPHFLQQTNQNPNDFTLFASTPHSSLNSYASTTKSAQPQNLPIIRTYHWHEASFVGRIIRLPPVYDLRQYRIFSRQPGTTGRGVFAVASTPRRRKSGSRTGKTPNVSENRIIRARIIACQSGRHAATSPAHPADRCRASFTQRPQ